MHEVPMELKEMESINEPILNLRYALCLSDESPNSFTRYTVEILRVRGLYVFNAW